jgi:hypothetical protein
VWLLSNPEEALKWVSRPIRLSLNWLAGKRSDDAADKSVRSGNLPDVENLPEEPSPESPNLFADSPLPNCRAVGQRDSEPDPPVIDPARESKSAPAPDDDMAPARSSKLPPNELFPHVLEPPPTLSEPTVFEMPVPAELAPDPTPAVVVAYSPIVCALACGANIAIAAIIAAGTIKLISLMAFDLP